MAKHPCPDCGVNLNVRHRCKPAKPPRPMGRRRQIRTCEVCGSGYTATYAEQRTCGRACGTKIHRRPEPKPKYPSCRVYVVTCPHCERLFATRSARKRMCSDGDCSRARLVASWARDKRRHPVVQSKACACGSEIAQNRQKCDACNAAHRKVRRKQDKRRRRALKLGVATERYTMAEIAARDRDQCGLCRKRVAMTKTAPHPKAPSIDHVVPLADGGDDTRANVQLAHFACNVQKRDGGSQQLALIG